MALPQWLGTRTGRGRVAARSANPADAHPAKRRPAESRHSPSRRHPVPAAVRRSATGASEEWQLFRGWRSFPVSLVQGVESMPFDLRKRGCPLTRAGGLWPENCPNPRLPATSRAPDLHSTHESRFSLRALARPRSRSWPLAGPQTHRRPLCQPAFCWFLTWRGCVCGESACRGWAQTDSRLARVNLLVLRLQRVNLRKNGLQRVTPPSASAITAGAPSASAIPTGAPSPSRFPAGAPCKRNPSRGTLREQTAGRESADKKASQKWPASQNSMVGDAGFEPATPSV